MMMNRESPKTYSGKLASILATLEKHPEGLPIQTAINIFTEYFGCPRKRTQKYFRELATIGKIHVDRKGRVRLRKNG